MIRPVIGVTVSQRSGWRIFPLMALNIWLAGGRAVKWQNPSDIELGAVDGVVIGGGDDISPTLYDGALTLEARLDPARDEMEATLLGAAFDRNLPILGICRGSQMMNIVLGGSLHQNAYGVYRSRKYHTILPRKTVTLEADSRLAGIVGCNPMRVNALHSQAVNSLGRGLRVAARDCDGMIQAIERTSEPFALGVQWHPEHLFYARRQRALFRTLVTAARAGRRNRAQLPAVTGLARDLHG
ncbi:gamma-glutamyl-gamma-aminobutyrate hydrolase family protein [Thalassococcus sp. S3]|uniref:gamma-glutamyl-gamma-aminobutyrate hydrolase family protein n=1 Tax=Thalassococcus sp. S3 TaxID=2017482 RepID=UPI00102484B8|nr:type 1 glutamine amidotransferase [Thalassococcus sp. S3]QBF29951.1 gamma-glutamyl-gamma-aminobutyrate hydrolase [Thalassococcus sp. S3]